jgi:hypothetical protein
LSEVMQVIPAHDRDAYGGIPRLPSHFPVDNARSGW